MKEMIKRVRDEKGGFTLAELLIVVAIILVLVAIAIPVFTGALNSANDAVLKADARSAKAQATTEYLLNDRAGSWAYSYTVDTDGNISLGSATENGSSVEASKGSDGTVTGTVVITASDAADAENG